MTRAAIAKKCARSCHWTRPRIDEPQIGFVDERRRLEDVVWTFARHLPPSQATEVVMHDRNQLLERAIITISPAHQ